MIVYKPFEDKYAMQVLGLLNQLGYKVNQEDLSKRILKIIEDGKGVVFVALQNENIVGCVHTMIVNRLAEGTCGEIVSLVVDESIRGNGIGKRLIDESADWLKKHGIVNLRVRCNTIRLEAHKFYNHLGFTEKKSQKVFEKNI